MVAAADHTSIDPRYAQKEVEKVIRKHSKTFLFSTGLLPRDARRAIRSLYGFCRATDDLVDRTDASQLDVERWRDQLNLPLSEQTNPILMMWSMVRDSYQVNRRYENELIDGVALDLTRKTYDTWEELARYCYHVASTVGLLSIPIIGLAEGASHADALPFAINLGIALQLTNILRDIGEDLDRGRVYLPLEDLHRFNLRLEDIHHRRVDDRFRGLMRFEIERANTLYQSSLPGIRFLAVGSAALLYRAILDEIEKMDFNVFQFRAHTTGWQKIAMMPKIIQYIRSIPSPQAPPTIPFAYV